MTDVLVLTDGADDYARQIRDAGCRGITLHVANEPGEIDDAARRAPVALARPAMLAEVINDLPALEWVQSTFAGVDPLLDAGLRRDYLLTGVKGVFGPLMSEYVFAQIIARERGFDELRAAQADRRWAPLPYRGLGGRTVGVAGLGSIGRHIVDTANHFGMRVVGYKRSPGDVPGVQRVYHGDQFDEFLEALDYLVLILPGTAEAKHLVNARALARMKKHAWIVNVGRGAVIDESALADALAEGRIGGAILDVFEEEPLPADSPLWTLDNCVVTPHVAAESFPEDIVRIFADNLARHQRGERPEHVIDFAKGY